MIGNKHKETNYDRAYLIYMSGKSLSQVGKIIGVTRQSVFKAFKSRGYEMRSIKKRRFQIYDNKKFSLRNNGYLSLTNGNRNLMHRYVWEKERGKIPDGWDIHHIDENKENNKVSNLECLPKSEHTRKYSPHNNQFTKGRKRDSYRTI